jgi:hypothetical protein
MLRLSLLALAASVVVAKGPTVTTKVFFDVVSSLALKIESVHA